MSEILEQGLNSLKHSLLTMSSHAVNRVSQSLEAMKKRDDELAHKVCQGDGILDQFEMDIDNHAHNLLALAPSQKSLRKITTAMKISMDLERVGDEATTIARRVLELSLDPPLKLTLEIPVMAQNGLEMLDQALAAFAQEDPKKAEDVIPQDLEVDRLYKGTQKELSEYMAQNPTSIKPCLNLLVIAKSLERIADHAKNVAESVVFMCQARDIRHNNQEYPLVASQP